MQAIVNRSFRASTLKALAKRGIQVLSPTLVLGEDGTWANARECWNVSDNDTGKVWTFTQVMDAAAA